MQQKMIVVSYSSLAAINRKVYTQLSKTFDLTLLIPASAIINNTVRMADPPVKDDARSLLLPLRGNNPRLHYLRGMWTVLKNTKPDYLFIENDPISAFTVVACFYKLFFGGIIFCQSNENFSLSFRRLLSRESIRSKLLLLAKRTVCFFVRPFIDEVYTINYDGKKLFEDLKFRKVSWIPLGYDPACFFEDITERNAVRQALGLNTFVIAYFGRIVPEKGLMLLLQALEELQAYSWQLLIDDFSHYTTSYITEIKNFITDKKLSGRVVFFHAGHDEMYKYMNAADLAVVPSVSTGTFKEQYGRVVQEAIACGCMTIVSDSGFLPHFFKEPFFIFKENDTVAIKKKIVEIIQLSQENKEKLRFPAMQYIGKHFSIGAQAQLVIDSADRLRTKKSL